MIFDTRALPTLTGPGWTTISPTSPSGEGSGFSGAGSRIVYVSSSGGSDVNTGTSSSPVATLAHGLSLIRDGKPDQLLLKCGDTWTESFGFVSQSGQGPGIVGSVCTGPLLIGSYGTGARPLINVATDPGIGANGSGGDYLAIQGIEFYDYQRDPNNGAYSYSVVTAANRNGPTRFIVQNNWLLVEDCKFSYGPNNIDLDWGTGTPKGTVIINRCIALFAYNIEPVHAEGTFLQGVQYPYFYENVFDNNGWSAQLTTAQSVTVAAGPVLTWPSAIPFGNGESLYCTVTGGGYTSGKNYTVSSAGVGGATKFSTTTGGGGTGTASFRWVGPEANKFNRNFYIHDTAGTPTPCVAIGNISSNSSCEGAQFRAGGTIVNNLFVANSNGFDLGHAPTDGGQTYTFANVHDNVILKSGGINSVPSQGFNYGCDIFQGQGPGVTIHDNIFAHEDRTDGYAFGITMFLESTLNGISVTNNIIFDWDAGINDLGVGTVLSGNTQDLTGANTGGAPEPFFDPTRTVETYDSHVLGGPGTLAHFISLAITNSRQSWNDAYTANAVNSYIRTGFGR